MAASSPLDGGEINRTQHVRLITIQLKSTKAAENSTNEGLYPGRGDQRPIGDRISR
jgi:hypothetical protein